MCNKSNENNWIEYRSFGQETDGVATDPGHVDVARGAPRSVQGFAGFPAGRFRHPASRQVFLATGHHSMARSATGFSSFTGQVAAVLQQILQVARKTNKQMNTKPKRLQFDQVRIQSYLHRGM